MLASMTERKAANGILQSKSKLSNRLTLKMTLRHKHAGNGLATKAVGGRVISDEVHQHGGVHQQIQY